MKTGLFSFLKDSHAPQRDKGFTVSGFPKEVMEEKWRRQFSFLFDLLFYYFVFPLTDMNSKHPFLSSFCFQAPLNTPVTEDRFGILTEKYRIPVPILPGKEW